MAKSRGRPSWFKMFFNQKALIDSVPPETAGLALKAAYAYFAGEDVPKMDPLTFAVFASIKPYIDDAFRDYELFSASGRKGGGRPPKENPDKPPLRGVTEEDKDKEEDEDKDADERGRRRTHARATAADPEPSFSPPAVEQVKAFCKEQGFRMAPAAFVDYYAARGWKMGQAPMTDWQAAARRWESREKGGKAEPDYSDGEDFLNG